MVRLLHINQTQMIMPDSQPFSGWSRVAMAIEEVIERLLRSTGILEAAGVPYAVLDENANANANANAVAEWVGCVGMAAVRFTRAPGPWCSLSDRARR
jgi:hypothetical protein